MSVVMKGSDIDFGSGSDQFVLIDQTVVPGPGIGPGPGPGPWARMRAGVPLPVSIGSLAGWEDQKVCSNEPDSSCVYGYEGG